MYSLWNRWPNFTHKSSTEILQQWYSYNRAITETRRCWNLHLHGSEQTETNGPKECRNTSFRYACLLYFIFTGFLRKFVCVGPMLRRQVGALGSLVILIYLNFGISVRIKGFAPRYSKVFGIKYII